MELKALDKQAKQMALQYKQCEQELVSIIAKMDSRKAFYKLGHPSLFAYMTQALGLSGAVASNISAVVRKSYEVPQLKNTVIRGDLSLSKARKLTPVITKDNQNQWLQMAKTKTQKQIEREVSLAQPKDAIFEKTQYISSHRETKEKVQIKRTLPRIKLELGLSEKLMLDLRRCQDLESQRQKKNIRLENCLEELVNLYLHKKDPLRKARRQKISGKVRLPLKKEASTSSSASDRKPNQRKVIPAKIKHQVQLRDRGQCSYENSSGKRCSSQRFLEIHHILPVSQGGKNNLENLRLLCHGHHKITHIK